MNSRWRCTIWTVKYYYFNVWLFRCYVKTANLCGSNICSVFFQLWFKQYQMHRGWKKAFLGWKNPQIPLTRKAFLVHSSNFFLQMNSIHLLFNALWFQQVEWSLWNKNVFTKMYFLVLDFSIACFSLSHLSLSRCTLFLWAGQTCCSQ